MQPAAPPTDASARALALYRAAVDHVARDAGAPTRTIDVRVTEGAPQPGARALADSRAGSVLVARAEAEALGALAGAAELDAGARRDFGQRLFTALHEASHVTGPPMPDDNPHAALDTMWEEALASLNARRLLPGFAQAAAGGQELGRPAIADVTYGGMAQRVTELLRLSGLEPDSAQFDATVRELAEVVPWIERPRHVAGLVVRGLRGGEPLDVPTSMVDQVRGYIQRSSAGTGRIAREVEELGQ